MVQLSEMVRSGDVNQSGLTQLRVLFIKEFTILQSQVKERSHFGTVWTNFYHIIGPWLSN